MILELLVMLVVLAVCFEVERLGLASTVTPAFGWQNWQLLDGWRHLLLHVGTVFPVVALVDMEIYAATHLRR